MFYISFGVEKWRSKKNARFCSICFDRKRSKNYRPARGALCAPAARETPRGGDALYLRGVYEKHVYIEKEGKFFNTKVYDIA